MTGNLPTPSEVRQVAVADSRSNSLIGRGLSSIQSGASTLAIADRDALYRKARDAYNRITDGGRKKDQNDRSRNSLSLGAFWTPAELIKLRSAFETFHKLANEGYGKAYFPLSVFFEGGQSVAEDIELARYYAKIAFNWCTVNQLQNDPEIWNDLGTLYRLNDGATRTEAIPRDDIKAMKWYRLAADQGNTWAQYEIGKLYENGHGVPQNNAEAVKWYRLAASQGNAWVQYYLGVNYDFGGLVPQDDAEAVRWYRLAANQGYAIAQINLGQMYTDGRGVPQNNAEAVKWYRLAAVQGDAIAQISLGTSYAEGLGVPENNAEAVRWYRLAADQGHVLAQHYLSKLGVDWKAL